MKDKLATFEYISDVTDKIDSLVEQSERTRGRAEKHSLLSEAQGLMDAYQDHCIAGGNDKKQFNPLI